MRPKEIAEFLDGMLGYENAPSIFLWGPPGVGKSSVVAQAAARAGIGFIDLRLSNMDPTDIRGILVPRGQKSVWLPPSMLPDEGQGILFLDEINMAPPLVQGGAHQLVLSGAVGEYRLPPGWRVIAAGNKAEHGAFVHKMSFPMRGRFVHIDFDVNLADWQEWAVLSTISPAVLEFISFRPDLLAPKFDAKSSENAYASPRGWEFVSRICRCGTVFSSNVFRQAVIGTVGQAAAAEFFAYLRLRMELPAIDEIFSGRDYVPAQADIAYALATALAVHAKPEHVNRLVDYSEKLPIEVAALLIRLLILKDRDAVLASPRFEAWAREHSAMII